MKVTDCLTLLRKEVSTRRWAVEGLIPLGTVGDISGPPGEGKSSLVLDLAIAVASGSGAWFGHRCITGKVVLLGGERDSEEVLALDIQRIANGRTPAQGLLLSPTTNDDDNPAIWHWNEQRWELTSWGKEVTGWLQVERPAMIVLDTHMAVTEGTNQVDNSQQYAFGRELKRWAKTLGSPVVLVISHTNQQSSTQKLSLRLHYLSRAGGNGLPGALRWVAGLSRLRTDDALAKKLGLAQRAEDSWLVAFGISKSNEMPHAVWSSDKPAIFEITKEGSIELVTQTALPNSYTQSIPLSDAQAFLDRVWPINETLGLEVVLDPENL